MQSDIFYSSYLTQLECLCFLFLTIIDSWVVSSGANMQPGCFRHSHTQVRRCCDDTSLVPFSIPPARSLRQTRGSAGPFLNKSRPQTSGFEIFIVKITLELLNRLPRRRRRVHLSTALQPPLLMGGDAFQGYPLSKNLTVFAVDGGLRWDV